MSHYFQTIRPRFWVILIAGLLVVMIGLYSALQSYIARQNETIAALNGEYASLREASAELEEKINYTYTDEYIEREARSKLGLIRAGETLYQSSGAGDGE
ncbi:MAG: septum formation initiator family protein [Clostridia bacterium]|nr:septum formation initiator family protein [Clostridia bacterium]MBO4885925.1 septum formation initiator family protein [Clostridia bacterium]MBR4443946.1 septum formation initiator family protein [Clostridia bacterium]